MHACTLRRLCTENETCHVVKHTSYMWCMRVCVCLARGLLGICWLCGMGVSDD
jgi:hypothetical protein